MSQRVLVISNYREYHSNRPEAEIFIGLAQRGVNIFVMTSSTGAYVTRFREAGIKVIDFMPKKKLNKKEIKTIREVIVQHDIQLIHLFNSPAIINGIQAAKHLPVKIVLYRGYAGNVHWYDPTWYLKYLHPRVDKIVCNSQGVEEHLQKQLFFNKKKTITIPKGHDLEWYKGIQPRNIRSELGIPDNGFILITVANNRKMKGIPYLLKAFNKIPNELPIYLILIGRNMDNNDNLSLIRNGGKVKKARILGYRDDALNIVAASDVYINASIKGEAINRSLAEAMSLGIPPIASNISGNNEMVIDGECGLLFPSKDTKALSQAIHRIFDDRNLRERLGQNAISRIQHFLNLQTTIEKTKKLYDELIEQNE